MIAKNSLFVVAWPRKCPLVGTNDPVACAILDDSRLQDVGVTRTEKVRPAQECRLHDGIVVRVLGYYPIGSGGEHNLGEITQAVDELRDGSLAQLPTRLQSRVGEHARGFAEDVW